MLQPRLDDPLAGLQKAIAREDLMGMSLEARTWSILASRSVPAGVRWPAS